MKWCRWHPGWRPDFIGGVCWVVVLLFCDKRLDGGCWAAGRIVSGNLGRVNANSERNEIGGLEMCQ